MPLWLPWRLIIASDLCDFLEGHCVHAVQQLVCVHGAGFTSCARQRQAEPVVECLWLSSETVICHIPKVLIIALAL